MNKPVKDLKDEQFLRLVEAEEEHLLTITITMDEITDNPNIQTFLEEIRQLYYRVMYCLKFYHKVYNFYKSEK